MSRLVELKAANSRSDVAELLGFKLKALAYILFKQTDAQKYKTFDIPKRSGGKRTICAPNDQLKELQSRLAALLQHCIDEINREKQIESAIAHGFRPGYSIVSNAAVHRNKRYVLNVDLENFFGAINFGRVRGFFIKNRNFALNPDVATVLAQIACYQNALPQGSPCSPVLSNLVGHILDIRLASLAYKTGCDYSRYADDLTFSTNRKLFPSDLAVQTQLDPNKWFAGKMLDTQIRACGFRLNVEKTRMQYKLSRQEVTGLVVNSVVNTRAEYRRVVRAKVHNLLTTGNFHLTKSTLDDKGNSVTVKEDGTLGQLNGMLTFIDMVYVKEWVRQCHVEEVRNSNTEIFRQFLMFKNFWASAMPVIVCEGKTDNVYLRAAIRRLATNFQKLATTEKDGEIKLSVRLQKKTKQSNRILRFDGGTGHLLGFIKAYREFCWSVKAPGKKNPVIVFVDNDDGAKGIFKFVANITKKPVDGSEAFYYISDNLYLVSTPLGPAAEPVSIESFFDPVLLDTKLGGKSFHPQEKSFDPKLHYGKHAFAENVVKKQEYKINFDGFKPILARFSAVIEHYATLTAPKAPS